MQPNFFDATESQFDFVNGDKEAALLGEYLRDTAGIELLLQLLEERHTDVSSLSLMILGNLCSDSFDPKSNETKAICAEHGGMIEVHAWQALPTRP